MRNRLRWEEMREGDREPDGRGVGDLSSVSRRTVHVDVESYGHAIFESEDKRGKSTMTKTTTSTSLSLFAIATDTEDFRERG